MRVNTPVRCKLRRLHAPVGGFSMVELMLAMMLGLIVVGGLGQLYVGGRSANRIIESTTLVNDNGRFAMELLARDTRLAGYFSCGGRKSKVAVARNDGNFWFDLKGLQGFDGGDANETADTLPAVFDDLPTPLREDGRWTDVFVIRYADVRSMIEVGSDDLDIGNKQFVFDTAHRFRIGDVAILNDAACGQTSVFQVTGGDNDDGSFRISYDPSAADVSPGNCTSKLAGDYNCSDSTLDLSAKDPADNFEEATISKLVARAFFVAKPDPDGCPALFAAGTEIAGAIPLVRNVADMQVEYGVDDDKRPNDPNSGDDSVDHYLSAHELNESEEEDLWPRVISLRITLILISTDCDCGDESIDCEKQFTTTVALRNDGGSVLASN